MDDLDENDPPPQLKLIELERETLAYKPIDPGFNQFANKNPFKIKIKINKKGVGGGQRNQRRENQRRENQRRENQRRENQRNQRKDDKFIILI